MKFFSFMTNYNSIIHHHRASVLHALQSISISNICGGSLKLATQNTVIGSPASRIAWKTRSSLSMLILDGGRATEFQISGFSNLPVALDRRKSRRSAKTSLQNRIRGQPCAAESCHVQPASDRGVVIRKIDRDRLLEIPQREVRVAQPGRHQPMHRAAEGTAVAAERLVIAEVCPPAVTGEFLGQSTTSACLMTFERCVRSRPSTTSIGTDRPA